MESLVNFLLNPWVMGILIFFSVFAITDMLQRLISQFMLKYQLKRMEAVKTEADERMKKLMDRMAQQKSEMNDIQSLLKK